MSYFDWIVLGIIMIFLIGVLILLLYGIEIFWIGLFIFCFILLGKVLGKKEFCYGIDWLFLLFLVFLIGFLRLIVYIGFDDWFSYYFGWLGEYMWSNFFLFVLLFFLLIFIV